MKGCPPSVHCKAYSSAWWSSTDWSRCCRLCTVDSVQKRKLKSITHSPAITLLAPVPAWMLLICQLVGWKNSLPWSHCMATNSAKAGDTKWMGFLARCG